MFEGGSILIKNMYFNHVIRQLLKCFDVIFLAICMIIVYVTLYQNVVRVPFIIITLLVIIYTLYTQEKWTFRWLSFLLFFPWLVGNECITIYDRYFSIQLFQIISVLVSVYVLRDGKSNKYMDGFNVKVLCGDIVIAIIFFGLPIIRAFEKGNIVFGFSLFVLALYWSEFVSRASEKWAKRKFCESNALQNGNLRRDRLIVCMMLGIALFFSVMLSVVYYPGIITRDCASIYKAAQHITDSSYRTDTHSFAWTMLVAVIDKVFHNYFAITIMVAVSFVLAWFYYMKVLYDCGLSLKVIVGLTVLWFCFPGNWYYLVCTWKDMPFAISMLTVSAIICGILLGNRQDKATYIALAIFSFAMSVFRSNGQIVLIFLTIVSVIAVIRKKNHFKGMALAFGIALAMLGIFKGPIFSILDVSGTPHGLYALPYIDGIWENVHQDVELSEATIEFIETEIMPLEEFKEAYVSAYTNRYVFPKGYEDISLEKAKNAYKECIILHPFITISARFKRTYNFWGLMLDMEFPADRNYISQIPDVTEFSKDYKWAFDDRFAVIRENIANLTTAAQAFGFLTMTFSRCGFCIILWTLFLRISNKNKEKLLFLIMPPAVNTIVLLIGSCFADYRYAYPMFMMTIPLIGDVLISQNITEQKV